MSGFLQGQRVLVLEDEYFAALDVQHMVESFGGLVIGPVGRLEEAQELARAESPDGAILDIKLDSVTSYPLARELLDMGAVVVFLTGYEPGSIEPEFRELPRIAKPFSPHRAERVLKSAFGRA